MVENSFMAVTNFQLSNIWDTESFINSFLFLLCRLLEADISILLKTAYESCKMKQALNTLVVRWVVNYDVDFTYLYFINEATASCQSTSEKKSWQTDVYHLKLNYEHIIWGVDMDE